MRKLTLVTLTLYLLVVAVAAQTTNTPVRVEPPGGGFVVVMPASAEERLEKQEGITNHIFVAKVDAGVYMVTYGDYDASEQIDPQKELEADRDNFNKVLKATLTMSRNISLAGRLGIEFTSETAEAKLRSKVFIKDHRVFQLAVMVRKDLDQAKMIESFFNSFAFTAKE
jgi:hypothetical protein